MNTKNYNVIFAKAIAVKADNEHEARIKAISELMDQGDIGINDIIRIDRISEGDEE
jgi:hypothetical protein